MGIATMWRMGIWAAVLLLSGCGMNDESPLVQEQMVNRSPAATYALLDKAWRVTAEERTQEVLKLRVSGDGESKIMLTYLKAGREILVETLSLRAGDAPGRTSLSHSAAPTDAATDQEREYFANSKERFGREFDRLCAMLNNSKTQNVMPAQSAALSNSGGNGDMTGGVVSGQSPMAIGGTDPVATTDPAEVAEPSVEAVAGTDPVAGTEPVADTAPGLNPA